MRGGPEVVGVRARLLEERGCSGGLSEEGRVPEESEEWIMAMFTGARDRRRALTEVGRGPRWQVEGRMISWRGG